MNLATPRDASWRSVAPPRAIAPHPNGAQEVRHASMCKARGVLAASATSAGPMHSINEDFHSPLDAPGNVFVVADGVGGGAVASSVSRALVSQLHRSLGDRAPDSDALCRALLDADRVIARRVARHGAGSGAATVAVCAPRDDDLSRWWVAWVGDCRVYRLAASGAEGAEIVTSDDTYRHLGEVPPPGSGPDDPARMVGNGAVDVPNVRSIDVSRGAMLVLCSDGVHKHVAVGDIARSMRGAAPLEARCARLVELARERGSRDDATVLVVQRPRTRVPFAARLALAAAAAMLVCGAAAWLTTPVAFLDFLTMW